MISAISEWTKSLGLAIIIISILEMLLPDNKLKKYIKVVMGLYILFTIISPFVKDKTSFAVDNLEFENYIASSTNMVNQTSMDNRIKELYIEEMEKNITKKVEEKGYNVTSCKVNAKITEQLEETKINKITIKVEKNEQSSENTKTEETIENKIVSSIQSIKKVEVSKDISNADEKSTLSNSEIKELKEYLINEYGVSEECLEIS